MDLSDWRTRIDEADRELVALLNRRARYVLEIARLKKALGLPVNDPQREEEVFRNVALANKVAKAKGGPLDQDAVLRVYERIINVYSSIQRRPMETSGSRHSDVGRQPSPNRPERKKNRPEAEKKKKAR